MRSLMMLGAGLAVCALGSVAGAAGEGSLTSQVKEGCKAELESYCKGVTPGEGRLLRYEQSEEPGGSLVAARETEAGELRGQAVSAGTPRRIGKGDFISIPAGIPHWVSAIEGKEIVYLVVKIKEAPHAR